MDYDDILADVCSREVENGLYNIVINNIKIYSFIRRDDIRDRVLKHYDKSVDAWDPAVSALERAKSVIVSFWQLFKIVLCKRRFSNVFHSFQRHELVNKVYVDKFTDPIIDYSDVGEDYIILEPGRKGHHPSPRDHAKKVVYTDSIALLARQMSVLRKRRYLNKNHQQLEELFRLLDKAFPEIEINKDAITDKIIRCDCLVLIYKFLFNRIKAKRLIAPARSHFLNLIPAAKQCNMKVLELQHGVTYSETLIYSG